MEDVRCTVSARVHAAIDLRSQSYSLWLESVNAAEIYGDLLFAPHHTVAAGEGVLTGRL